MGDEWREHSPDDAGADAGSGNGADGGVWREALASVGRRDEAQGRVRLPAAGTIYRRATAEAPEEDAPEVGPAHAATADARATMRRALRPVRWMEWIGAAASAIAIVLVVRWAMRDEVASRLVALLAESSAFRKLVEGIGGATAAPDGGAASFWPPSLTWPPPEAWTPSMIVVVGTTVAVVAALVTALVSPEPTEL